MQVEPNGEAPVVVTGASGFIGSALVASLRASGVRVLAVDVRPCPEASVQSLTGDLADADVIAAVFAARPSAVLHLAARTSVLQSVRDPQGVYAVNAAVTQQLLEAARRAGTGCFVLASTNAVVGETGGAVIDERSPLRPLTPYGATKAAAEMLCSAYAQSYGIAASAVRLTNVYGPGMGAKDTFVVRLLRAAAGGATASVYGDGGQERDYLYVDDAVAGLRLAWEHALRGPVVIGTGRSTSVQELVALAREATGAPIVTGSVAAPVGEMRAVRVDISYARSLGFEPRVELAEGLARTWEALR